MGRMRYSRERQIKPVKQRMNKEIKNHPISKIRNSFERDGFLDSTFKWHREYNNVSFNTKIYYPHEHITKLSVDLYRQDSVYY